MKQKLEEYNTKKLVETIEKQTKLNFDQFEPYIQSIRFPLFKNLKEDTSISFDFPLTVLVGPNGCNKTSILHALYGSPSGKSIGQYWFSTDMDKIQDRSCFIYSYQHPVAKKNVEVLKTRIQKESNPDYWEPSRPVKKLGMTIPSKAELANANNKNKSRWDLLEKNVLFLDFKDTVSAFDYEFYHNYFSPKKTLKTRQDKIRKESQYIKSVIDNDSTSFFHNTKERIVSNRLLSDETCKIISELLNKTYSEIRIVEHYFYRNDKCLTTIHIKDQSYSYSEAFAGAGEFRLILMVDKILSAECNSLILIDEPENSIHPGAQNKFRDFLLREIIKKKHQIVVTTHSPDFIDNLPNKALVLMCPDKTKINAISNIPFFEAFNELGHEDSDKKQIYVEDELAQQLLLKYLKTRSIEHSYTVKVFPGGAENIIKASIKNNSLIPNDNHLYLLDGDKNYYPYNKIGDVVSDYERWLDEKHQKLNESKISDQDKENLALIIKIITNVKVFKADKTDEDFLCKKKQMEMFLRFWYKKVFFFPCQTPEIGILSNSPLTESKYSSFKDNGKEELIQYIINDLGENRNNIDNKICKFEAQRLIHKIPANSDLFNELDTIFEHIQESE